MAQLEAHANEGYWLLDYRASLLDLGTTVNSVLLPLAYQIEIRLLMDLARSEAESGSTTFKTSIAIAEELICEAILRCQPINLSGYRVNLTAIENIVANNPALAKDYKKYRSTSKEPTSPGYSCLLLS